MRVKWTVSFYLKKYMNIFLFNKSPIKVSYRKGNNQPIDTRLKT